MRYGVVLVPGPATPEVAKEAERLGLSSVWVYDSPLAMPDPFVALTRCALATGRVLLGTGVTSPRLRNVGATATAFASLAALAPGRVRMGIGSGNTARRTFGMRPVPNAELRRFVEDFRALLAGEEVSFEEAGREAPARLLYDVASLTGGQAVPVVVAGAAPGSAALAGEVGDGLMAFGVVQPEAATGLRALFDAAGPDPADRSRPFYAMSAVHLAASHDDRYGPAAQDAVGNVVASLLAYVLQNPSSAGLLSESGVASAQALAQSLGWPGEDPGRSHQALYRNYLGRIAERDRAVVTPELVDAFTISGDAGYCRERLAALEEAGVTDFVFQPVVDPLREIRELHDAVS